MPPETSARLASAAFAARPVWALCCAKIIEPVETVYYALIFSRAKMKNLIIKFQYEMIQEDKGPSTTSFLPANGMAVLSVKAIFA
ncbi:MAG: hypothetical protein EBR09_04875 [Proteobacteria bacterium]|nr:hypothetical protein [Pseudomonadota bacterium]